MQKLYAAMLAAPFVAVILTGCSAAPTVEAAQPSSQAFEQTVTAQVNQPAPVPTPIFTPPSGPATFIYNGELTQGGWIRGQAPAGTLSASLGDQPLVLDPQGKFFAAFDRDASGTALLKATLRDGREVQSAIAVSPRKWNIERVNVARRRGGSSEAFMRRRRPELAQIGAARSAESQIDGWSQNFIWPVKARISGRFGSQRIYRGVPGSYHTGIDIAGGNGTRFVAPADGVVTLATKTPFSLEGYLLMIDHGQGLNSAFLHCSKIAVKEGDVVRQGQYIGNIGSSGRATGPHLHWGLKWRDARLDPLLFTGPL